MESRGAKMSAERQHIARRITTSQRKMTAAAVSSPIACRSCATHAGRRAAAASAKPQPRTQQPNPRVVSTSARVLGSERLQ